MIYIASPYSSVSEDVEAQRYFAVKRFAALQMTKGDIVFSPIVYGYQFHKDGLSAGDAAYWWQFNKEMLSISTKMIVLKLPGWDTSVGVKMEIKYAQENNIPVEFAEWL